MVVLFHRPMIMFLVSSCVVGALPGSSSLHEELNVAVAIMQSAARSVELSDFIVFITFNFSSKYIIKRAIFLHQSSIFNISGCKVTQNNATFPHSPFTFLIIGSPELHSPVQPIAWFFACVASKSFTNLSNHFLVVVMAYVFPSPRKFSHTSFLRFQVHLFELTLNLLLDHYRI